MRFRFLPLTVIPLTILAAFLSLASPEIACAKEKESADKSESKSESKSEDAPIDFTDWKKWRIPVDPKRVAEIAAMLDEKPQGVGAVIDQRDFWDRLAKQPTASRPIKQAETYAKRPTPEFSEKLYLDYHEGSKRREPYNRGYRRPILSAFNALVIAECLENQGRFLPDLERYLTTICEMRSWTNPWHDRGLASFKKGTPQIALESSALADQLATARFWLGDRLSPELRSRIAAELERRTFQVFEQAIRKKTGSMNWWITGTNNWNPVCLNGVVRAALTEIESKERRAFFIAAAERSVRHFFKGFSPNGYCDEGVGYWSYGVGNYALLAEAVYQATDGQVDWFRNSPAADIPGTPSVADIARYPERIQITPKISPSFADCSIKASGDLYTLTLLRCRLNLPGKTYGPLDVEQRKAGTLTINNYQFIPIFATLAKTIDRAKPQVALETSKDSSGKARFEEQRSYYDRHGVLVARPGAATDCRLSIAILGGHNAESHNHNDVGTYVLVCDGKIPLVDPGSEVYTRRTFSSKRYESDVINSFGHPVPRVAGRLQSKGRKAAGKILLAQFSDREDRIKMDITSAYAVKTLRSLVRRFIYSREGKGKVTIIDTVTFNRPESFESALITFEPWEQLDKNRLRIGQGKGAVEVKFTCTACPIQIKPTIIHEDLAGRKGKDDDVTRLALVLARPVKKATLKVEIRPWEP